MDDPTETLTEENFSFPKYIGLLYSPKNEAYALGLVKQLRVSKIVPVYLGFGDRDQITVYEYEVKVPSVQAVLLRSAWLRPKGSLDQLSNLAVQVLVDGHIVHEQPLEHHLRIGPEVPLQKNASWNHNAIELDDKGQALPEKHYGVFCPNETLVQIRVVKSKRGVVEFQARCGLTAALYSTRSGDISA